jgi:DNA helicase-2/ATP-dependent DNA helicase PcrA
MAETATGRHSRHTAGSRTTPRPLDTAAEKKVSRCHDCPASYDEGLYERLREWRLARAAEDKVPAFVVFTDATLQLVAEHRPTSEDALLRINGVGRKKIEQYGADVLTVVAGAVEEI